VCWAKLAETASQYLTKGASIYLEGRIQTRSWDDKEGKRHYMTEVIANELVMLGGRGDGQAKGAARAAGGATRASEPPEPQFSGPPVEITDDDIPF
ncbi:MAG: single-stranded DNA-binding protein, partial [Terriglobales bacterium]